MEQGERKAAMREWRRMNYHTLNIEEVEKKLNTDIEQGLTTSEAQKRIEQYGYNELEKHKKQSDLLLFSANLKTF